MRRSAILVALTSLVVVASPAGAAERDPWAPPSRGGERPFRFDPVWNDRFALAATLGGPLGIVSAEAEYAPWSILALSAGVGAAAYGPQLGGMLRLRMPFRRSALGFGAGPSIGRYVGGDGRDIFSSMGHGDTWHAEYERVTWANFEGYYEHRGDVLLTRFLLGFAAPAAKGGEVRCRNQRDDVDPTGRECNLDDAVAYVGFSVGLRVP